MNIKQVLFVAAILMSGCASNHNLNEDGVNRFGGGGFRDSEILIGFHKLMVRTNSGLSENLSTAREAWKKRATELCDGSGYKDIKIHENSYNASSGGEFEPPWPLIRTKRTGYILCTPSTTTLEDVEEYLANRGRKIN